MNSKGVHKELIHKRFMRSSREVQKKVDGKFIRGL
jgi:hypothetical protein